MPLGGGRQRALLALLLLSANRVVGRDRLVAELFGEYPSEGAAHAVTVAVSRLRKAIGEDDNRLESRPPGYRLRVEAGELDLEVFEQLVSEGRRALEQGEATIAALRLRSAESLWRGGPLADVELQPRARVEVDRFEELRLGAIEDRIEAELKMGRSSALVPELEALVGGNPLRERLRGQLMLAFYRSGRQADALEAFRRFRRFAVDELGLEPGPALKRLEQAILRQDAEIEAPHSPAPPSANQPAPQSVSERNSVNGQYEAVSRRSRRLAVGLLAALVLAVLGGVDLATRDTSSRAFTGQEASLYRFTPGGAVDAQVQLAADPTALTDAFGALWVAERTDGVVVRVDKKTRAVAATIRVGRSPAAIAAGAGNIWVTDGLLGTLARIAPQANLVTQTISVGHDPSAVCVAGGRVWVADRGDGKVVSIDPKTGRVAAVVATGVAPTALVAADGLLWVANEGSGTVTAIDVHTAKVSEVISVGVAPSKLVVTGGNVWVLDQLDASVSRVDPQRRVVASTTSLGGAPSALAAAHGFVWVTDDRTGTLSQLDPGTGVVRAVVHVGGRPLALNASGRLWAAVGASGADHRGGTLRLVASPDVLDTVDPVASTSVGVAPPGFLGLSNDGLVTLNHVDGPAGSRLVPDLAGALPESPDGGRTYTFRLRPGIRFSTGAAVRAQDVRHSFERLFDVRSSGAAFYTAIAGARRCLQSSLPCALSDGVRIDEGRRLVTFHLERPDPAFLAKLALPYADVLPTKTPRSIQASPVAATGPYMITSYSPGIGVRFERNPFFQEWSAAAQPAGYPDRISIRLSTRGAWLVASGRADFTGGVQYGPSTLTHSLLLHHPDLVRINPALATNFLFLNVNVAPFNDLRVRRALNLAIDRRAVVASRGGQLGGLPTCQILPPGLSGYRRYCPYTRNDAPGRSWRGNDLKRARTLVAAAGTAGMAVGVWDIAPSPESRAAVAALNLLGYRASLHLLPDKSFFTYTNDSQNHAQVITGGWTADYPSASDFIGKLTCNHFVPGNGNATLDASELCDPHLDQQILQAATVEETAPADAAQLWAQLDRQLTDRAVWVPTVTPAELDLLSPRVTNYHYNPVWGALVDQFWLR